MFIRFMSNVFSFHVNTTVKLHFHFGLGVKEFSRISTFILNVNIFLNVINSLGISEFSSKARSVLTVYRESYMYSELGYVPA